jgi:hypothetical protein
MPVQSKMTSYAQACKKMWSKALAKIKTNPQKYLPEKVKVMLAELGLDINDAEMVDALLTQWQDNERVKNKNGTMSVFAKYMEDVRIVLMNEVLGDSFTTQLLFGGGTYNREVASIPSKNVIIPGIKTAKGNPVTLYSPEWVWITSQSLFEQYCHKNGTTVNDSSPAHKEMLKIIYKRLSKKVVECNLPNSNIAVYINFNIIQKKEASDVQIKISQYMYGDKDSTFAVVSTSGGGSHSFDIMNKDLLHSSGGISYTNEEGKKMIAALLYKRDSERMSKAVDDALAKQAEEAAEAADDADAAEAAEAAEDAPCVQSEKKRRTEAPFSAELPIIGKDGKNLTFTFPNFTTHKTRIVLNKRMEYSKTKSFGSQATRGGSGSRSIFGATRGGGNYGAEERAEDNTIDAEMLKAFDGITITICARGDDICEMPLITMEIPDNPTITLQPGNLQVNVVLCCNRHPPEWREANLQTDEDVEREEEADALYFVEEILENMLKARLHLKNELAKVPNSHNTTILTKADFNHFDKTKPDAELLLKNSAGDLLKNRFNPFETDMPDFDGDDFDIEKFCQGCDEAKISDPAPAPTQESETVPAPMESELVPAPTQESETAPTPIQESEPVPAPTLESEPVPMQMNFVTWDDNETVPHVLLVSLGDKPVCGSAPNIYLDVKQHDGKDDEEGERFDQKNIQVIDRGTYREVMYKVEPDLLNKVTIKMTHELDITPVYVTEKGEEQPEEEITMQVEEPFLLPFPIQKEAGEEPDSWIIRSGSEILLKITFLLK